MDRIAKIVVLGSCKGGPDCKSVVVLGSGKGGPDC